jgi:hypothetical protein
MFFIRQLIIGYYDIADEAERNDLDAAIVSANFDDDDVRLIELLKKQQSYREIANTLKSNKTTISRKVNKICRQLSDLLGDDYCDSVVLTKVSRVLGRPLTEEELIFCNYVMGDPDKAGKISIFNFKIRNGRIIDGSRQDTKEGQMDMP